MLAHWTLTRPFELISKCSAGMMQSTYILVSCAARGLVVTASLVEVERNNVENYLLVSSVWSVSRVRRLTVKRKRAAVATQEVVEKAGALIAGRVAARDDLTIAADGVSVVANGGSLTVIVCGWDSSGDAGSRDDGGDDLGDLHICGWLFEAERLE